MTTRRVGVAIASTREIVRRGGNARDDLQVVRAGDFEALGGKQREQPIVVAAAVAQPPAAHVERDAGHEHPVDVAQVATRGSDASGSGMPR